MFSHHMNIEQISTPPHWGIAKLKFMTTIKTAKEDNTGLPYIALENVESNTMKFVPSESEYDPSAAITCDEGDLLFGKLRPYLAKVYMLKEKSCCSSEFMVFSNFSGDREFLKYVLISDGFIDTVNGSTYGAKMPRANPDFVKNIGFPLPPIDEQHSIAEFLDRNCGKIDEAIARHKAIIKKTEAYKNIIIKNAISKGLNPDIKTKDTGVEWIPEIPEAWQCISLKRISTIQTGSTPSKAEGNTNFSDTEGIPWIKPENLDSLSPIHETSEYLTSDGESEGRVFQPFSVYVCCIASVGKVGYSDKACSCNQQINAITFNPDIINWKYGFYALKASKEEHVAKANTNVQTIINSTQEGYIKIPVPPLTEQEQIASFLDEKCTEIDNFVALENALIDKLEEYKKSLIYNAVTGKIDCTEEQ